MVVVGVVVIAVVVVEVVAGVVVVVNKADALVVDVVVVGEVNEVVDVVVDVVIDFVVDFVVSKMSGLLLPFFAKKIYRISGLYFTHLKLVFSFLSRQNSNFMG